MLFWSAERGLYYISSACACKHCPLHTPDSPGSFGLHGASHSACRACALSEANVTPKRRAEDSPSDGWCPPPRYARCNGAFTQTCHCVVLMTLQASLASAVRNVIQISSRVMRLKGADTLCEPAAGLAIALDVLVFWWPPQAGSHRTPRKQLHAWRISPAQTLTEYFPGSLGGQLCLKASFSPRELP